MFYTLIFTQSFRPRTAAFCFKLVLSQVWQPFFCNYKRKALEIHRRYLHMNAALFIEILKFIMSLHGPCRSRKCCAADVLMEGSWGHHWKFTNHTITVNLFIYSIFIRDVPVTCRQSTFVYLKHKIMADKSTIKCNSVTVKTTKRFYNKSTSDCTSNTFIINSNLVPRTHKVLDSNDQMCDALNKIENWSQKILVLF